jgi:uncharacterized Zn finger protein
MSFWGYRPYAPVAQRRWNALKEIEKLKKKGRVVSPVVIEGRKIAKSFWGKAWCDNLECYSDYENRLPRGRTYVNNGSVIDLQIERGKVEALVSGSEIYEVKVDIAVAASARWKAICADCAGSVGSIVELLQGKLSKNVMERVCREADGLFPTPKEIKMSCSCPDWAGMCKHVAATLYGVGARLDRDPDVLFTLRGVNRSELISTGADFSITEAAASSERVLASDDIAALFGLEIETPVASVKDSGRKTKSTRPDVGAKPSVVVRKSNVNENASQRRDSSGTIAAQERQARPPAKMQVTSEPIGLATSPAPIAFEKKAAIPATASAAGGGSPKARRGAGGSERVDRPKPKAKVGQSGDRAWTSASATAKPSAKMQKASEPVNGTAVATTNPERSIAAKATTGPTPERESTSRSAGPGNRSKARTRVAKWIGARARKAARP